MPNSETRYVYCFQQLDGVKERPVLAEFVKEMGAQRCIVKVLKKEHTVHRGSCSETPFTLSEAAQYAPVAKAPKKGKAEPTPQAVAATEVQAKLVAKAGNLKSRFS